MQELNEKYNYIFFLKLSEKLPESYFHISNELSEYGVTVVPVNLNDLINLCSYQRPIVFTLCPDFKSYSFFLSFRKKFIDFAIKSKKITLLDVSSFAAAFFGNASTSTFLKKHYYHVQIPQTVKAISSVIMAIITDKSKGLGKWPGGKRAKLPDMESG